MLKWKKKFFCDVIASVLYRGFSCDVISNNFASHPTATGDRHVGFTVHGLVLETQQNVPELFLVHITIPNYNQVTRILTHIFS